MKKDVEEVDDLEEDELTDEEEGTEESSDEEHEEHEEHDGLTPGEGYTAEGLKGENPEVKNDCFGRQAQPKIQPPMLCFGRKEGDSPVETAHTHAKKTVDLDVLLRHLELQREMHIKLKAAVVFLFNVFCVAYVAIYQLETRLMYMSATAIESVFENAGSSAGMDEISRESVASERDIFLWMDYLVEDVTATDWYSPEFSRLGEYYEVCEDGPGKCKQSWYPVFVADHYEIPVERKSAIRKYNHVIGGIKITQMRAPHETSLEHTYLREEEFPAYALPRFEPAPGYKRYSKKAASYVITDETKFDSVFPRGVTAQIERFAPVFSTDHRFNLVGMSEQAQEFPTMLGTKNILSVSKKLIYNCLVRDPEGAGSLAKNTTASMCQGLEDDPDTSKFFEYFNLNNTELDAETGEPMPFNKTVVEERADIVIEEMWEGNSTFFNQTDGTVAYRHALIRKKTIEQGAHSIGQYLHRIFEVDERGRYSIYLDPYWTAGYMKDVLKFASSHAWIDHQTRKFMVTVPTYNPSTNTFVLGTATCDIQVGGAVFCETKMDVMRPISYGAGEMLRLAFEIMIMVLNCRLLWTVGSRIKHILKEQEYAMVIMAEKEKTMSMQPTQHLKIKFESGRIMLMRRNQLRKKCTGFLKQKDDRSDEVVNAEDAQKFVDDFLNEATIVVGDMVEPKESAKVDPRRVDKAILMYLGGDLSQGLELVMIILVLVCAGIWLSLIGNSQNLIIESRYDLIDPAQTTDMETMLTSIELLTARFSTYRFAAAVLVLVLFLKGAISLAFLPRVEVITKTFSGAFENLVYFAIIFVLLIVGFAILIHCVAGNTVRSFAVLGRSVLSCFDILVGSFDASKLDDAGSQTVAHLFYYTFNILMVWVLINVFIAIISDSYAQAQEEAEEKVSMTQLTWKFWIRPDHRLDEIIAMINRAIRIKKYTQLLHHAYQAQYEIFDEEIDEMQKEDHTALENANVETDEHADLQLQQIKDRHREQKEALEKLSGAVLMLADLSRKMELHVLNPDTNPHNYKPDLIKTMGHLRPTSRFAMFTIVRKQHILNDRSKKEFVMINDVANKVANTFKEVTASLGLSMDPHKPRGEDGDGFSLKTKTDELLAFYFPLLRQTYQQREIHQIFQAVAGIECPLELLIKSKHDNTKSDVDVAKAKLEKEIDDDEHLKVVKNILVYKIEQFKKQISSMQLAQQNVHIEYEKQIRSVKTSRRKMKMAYGTG